MCRYGCFLDLFKHIQEHEGGLDNFTKGYNYYGVHRLPDNSIVVREWAPGAEGIYLKGDFSEFTGPFPCCQLQGCLLKSRPHMFTCILVS